MSTGRDKEFEVVDPEALDSRALAAEIANSEIGYVEPGDIRDLLSSEQRRERNKRAEALEKALEASLKELEAQGKLK